MNPPSTPTGGPHRPRRRPAGAWLALLLAAAALAACERAAPPPADGGPGPAVTPAPPAPAIDQPAAAPPRRSAPPPVAPDRRSLILLGASVGPGTSRRLSWSGGQSFDGGSGDTPVLVVNGVGEGPVLCLTAATHGDELNGIEIVRRIMQDLDPGKLSGAVIGIPIVNLQGFRRGSRYLPDRRDLNRYFPGNPNGSAAARIAHSLFDNIIRNCSVLVDVHTGSLNRTNLPQLRADLRYERIRQLADGFGGMVVLHSPGVSGTLRRAATDAGIPAVVLEAGEPGRLQSASVREGTAGIERLLDSLGMRDKRPLLAEPRPVYYQSTWVRADFGGILFSLVRLGQVVSVGDVLGTVTDPITNEQNLIYSPVRGRVLGMALNQVVMPGFATFNIGIETPASVNGSLLAALEPPPGDNGSNGGRERLAGDAEERPE